MEWIRWRNDNNREEVMKHRQENAPRENSRNILLTRADRQTTKRKLTIMVEAKETDDAPTVANKNSNKTRKVSFSFLHHVSGLTNERKYTHLTLAGNNDNTRLNTP